MDDILSLMEGRVFHVTKNDYLPSILADEQIKPNTDGALPTTFGSSSNAYFRKRGCVALFDYRSTPTEEIRFHRSKCWPLMPAHDCKGGIAILLLKPEACDGLISWVESKKNGVPSEMIVPYVEAGYPGAISIELVDEVVCLKLEEDPNCLAARLRAGRNATSKQVE
jgi:hypothetical protein